MKQHESHKNTDIFYPLKWELIRTKKFNNGEDIPALMCHTVIPKGPECATNGACH